MKDEPTEQWDINANTTIDTDENFNRTWIELKDNAFSHLLSLLTTHITPIREVSRQEPVYIHW
jgi:hypothetical protein